MPFVYGVVPGVNFTTNAAANTEIDALFVKPGTRSLSVLSSIMQGKGANLTSLSGIIQRIKRFNTTSSSGGSAVTPSPRDSGSPAAGFTAGQASAGVVQGTGGPVLQVAFGCSGSGPGQWNWLNNQDVAIFVPGGANNSIDFFNSSGATSLVFETDCDAQE
jgi:hypothetical protein